MIESALLQYGIAGLSVVCILLIVRAFSTYMMRVQEQQEKRLTAWYAQYQDSINQWYDKNEAKMDRWFDQWVAGRAKDIEVQTRTLTTLDAHVTLLGKLSDGQGEICRKLNGGRKGGR